jgi:hypothetical protein
MKHVLVLSALAGLALATTLATTAAGAGNPVESRANGSGHRISGGEFRSFSFSAVRYEDGSARGEAQVYPRALDAFAHIAIDCMVLLPGNRAHMSGVVTHTSDPAVFIPGEYVHFAVEDNGEGADSPPDRVTGIPEDEPLRCDAGELGKASFNNIVRGNVQVR